MQITLVKKIRADGTPCAKCQDVESRLLAGGYMDRIDEVLIADERDTESPGMRMAAALGVDRAPFFVVTEGERRDVYTVYFKFVREVLNAQLREQDENQELLRDNPELDLI